MDLFTSLEWPMLGPSWELGVRCSHVGSSLQAQGRTPEHWLSTGQALCPEGGLWAIPLHEKKEFPGQVTSEDRGQDDG